MWDARNRTLGGIKNHDSGRMFADSGQGLITPRGSVGEVWSYCSFINAPEDRFNAGVKTSLFLHYHYLASARSMKGGFFSRSSISSISFHLLCAFPGIVVLMLCSPLLLFLSWLCLLLSTPWLSLLRSPLRPSPFSFSTSSRYAALRGPKIPKVQVWGLWDVSYGNRQKNYVHTMAKIQNRDRFTGAETIIYENSRSPVRTIFRDWVEDMLCPVQADGRISVPTSAICFEILGKEVVVDIARLHQLADLNDSMVNNRGILETRSEYSLLAWLGPVS